MRLSTLLAFVALLTQVSGFKTPAVNVFHVSPQERWHSQQQRHSLQMAPILESYNNIAADAPGFALGASEIASLAIPVVAFAAGTVSLLDRNKLQDEVSIAEELLETAKKALQNSNSLIALSFGATAISLLVSISNIAGESITTSYAGSKAPTKLKTPTTTVSKLGPSTTKVVDEAEKTYDNLMDKLTAIVPEPVAVPVPANNDAGDKVSAPETKTADAALPKTEEPKKEPVGEKKVDPSPEKKEEPKKEPVAEKKTDPIPEKREEPKKEPVAEKKADPVPLKKEEPKKEPVAEKKVDPVPVKKEDPKKEPVAVKPVEPVVAKKPQAVVVKKPSEDPKRESSLLSRFSFVKPEQKQVTPPKKTESSNAANVNALAVAGAAAFVVIAGAGIALSGEGETGERPSQSNANSSGLPSDQASSFSGNDKSGYLGALKSGATNTRTSAPSQSTASSSSYLDALKSGSSPAQRTGNQTPGRMTSPPGRTSARPGQMMGRQGSGGMPQQRRNIDAPTGPAGAGSYLDALRSGAKQKAPKMVSSIKTSMRQNNDAVSSDQSRREPGNISPNLVADETSTMQPPPRGGPPLRGQAPLQRGTPPQRGQAPPTSMQQNMRQRPATPRFDADSSGYAGEPGSSRPTFDSYLDAKSGGSNGFQPNGGGVNGAGRSETQRNSGPGTGFDEASSQDKNGSYLDSMEPDRRGRRGPSFSGVGKRVRDESQQSTDSDSYLSSL